MKKINFLFFLLAACLNLLAQDIQSKADEYMKSLVSQYKFNGTVFIAKDNQVLFQKGYGFRDVDKKINHDVN